MDCFDAHSNGQERELPLGQRFEVCLSENPTTGFSWSLTSHGEPVCTLVQDFYESPNGLPGQGGTHHWQFQTTQAGLGTIEMVYRRPWEEEGKRTQRFTLCIRVPHEHLSQ